LVRGQPRANAATAPRAAAVKHTKRAYAQDYVSQLVKEKGKIKLLREYLNVISTARILLPNGLADVPEPKL
jgi:ketosteroid isomerase-like protein